MTDWLGGELKEGSGLVDSRVSDGLRPRVMVQAPAAVIAPPPSPAPSLTT